MTSTNDNSEEKRYPTSFSVINNEGAVKFLEDARTFIELADRLVEHVGVDKLMPSNTGNVDKFNTAAPSNNSNSINSDKNDNNDSNDQDLTKSCDPEQVSKIKIWGWLVPAHPSSSQMKVR